MGPILDPNMTLFWALLGPYSAAQALFIWGFTVKPVLHRDPLDPGMAQKWGHIWDLL